MRKLGHLSVALALSLAALPASAQEFTLELKPTVLDLMPTILSMDGEEKELSAEARSSIERSGEIKIREAGSEVILSVASDILFAFDKADIQPEARRSLSDIAVVITNASDGVVLVLGHTDSKGSDVYNLALSERRAKAVADFLVAQKVPEVRLRIEGRGENEPVAENEIDGKDNPDGRTLNRRVEFVFPRAMLQN